MVQSAGHDRPGPRPAEHGRMYAWYVAVMLAAMYGLAVIDRYLLGLLQEPMKAQLGFSDTQLGLLQGPAFLLLFCVSSIPIGMLTDMTSRRNLIIAGIVVWSVATGATAFATSFETMFLARMMVGLGEACVLPAGMSLIASYFPPQQLGRATGVFTLGASIGKIAAFMGGAVLFAYLSAPALVGALPAGRTAWQAIFLLATVPGIAMALLFLTVREPRRTTVSASKLDLLKGAAGHIRGHAAAYASLALATAVSNGIAMTLATWAVSYFARVHHMSIAKAGGLIGTIALVGAPLGMIGGSWLIDWLRRRGVMSSAVYVYAGMHLFVALSGLSFYLAANSLRDAVIGYLILQATLAAALPAVLAATQLITPERYRGSAMSLIVIVQTIAGGMTVPTLVGVMTDHVFTAPGGIASALTMLICGAALLSGIVGFLMLPRYTGALRQAQPDSPASRPRPEAEAAARSAGTRYAGARPANLQAP